MKVYLSAIQTYLIAFAFFGIDVCYAQSKDKRAEAIIQKSLDFYLGLDDWSTNFSYEIKGIGARYSLQRGKMKFTSMNRYYLKMEDQETYCDGKKIWVYLPYNNEYMMFHLGEWTYGNLLQMIYSMYFSKADIFYEGTERLKNGRTHHKLRFKMLETHLTYSTAYAWYDVNTARLSCVTFLDRQKRQQIYKFSGFRSNEGINPQSFVFKPEEYPGIELRR